MLGLYCCLDFPLVAASGGSSLGVMQGLLSRCDAGASLEWNRGFSSCGPLTLEPRPRSGGTWLSCSTACGIFPPGIEPCLFHWQMDFYYQGNPAFRPFKLQLPGLCLGLQETLLFPSSQPHVSRLALLWTCFGLVTFWGQKLCQTCSVPYPQNLKWCLTISIHWINKCVYISMDEWMDGIT